MPMQNKTNKQNSWGIPIVFNIKLFETVTENSH